MAVAVRFHGTVRGRRDGLDGVCGKCEADTGSNAVVDEAKVVGGRADVAGFTGANVGGVALCSEAANERGGIHGRDPKFPPGRVTGRAYGPCPVHILGTIEKFGMSG